MAKEKLSLTALKVESCITSLSGDQLEKIKGGAATLHGRRKNYTIRWTAIDTRVQTDYVGSHVPSTIGNG